ncbi:hypothetical protein BDN71DRAFT_618747 [Pleurotus eryngii]|uniref:Uncharacterized protein n=1 Tax=Pleurotus eryngii TaxID=5323 RepID=A0A9P5ZI16_PLEER|nr:hypothetical protein BDN71DRAFT_618747 [Pleurotus eryngii]
MQPSTPPVDRALRYDISPTNPPTIVYLPITVSRQRPTSTESDGPIRTRPPRMVRGHQDEDILLLYTDGALHERRKKEGKWRKGKRPCKREGRCLVRLRVYERAKGERNRGNRETKKQKGKRGKRRKRQKYVPFRSTFACILFR